MFPVTQWSLVARAAADKTAVRVDALNSLLTSYLPALRAHLIYNMRIGADRADDLVQGFVAEKILHKGILEKADKTRGRFRGFLVAVFSRYVISQIRRERAQKRAPDAMGVSLDEYPDVVACAPEEEKAFNVVWAQQLVSQVCDRMRKECERKGRADVWKVFECRILGPILYETPMADYDELVRRFGFKSPAQASNVLITGKRMFKRILLELVQETVTDESEVEAEIDDLKTILAKAGAG